MKKSYFLFVAFILAFQSLANAQSSNMPLGRDEYQWLDHISIKSGKSPEGFNTTLKSYDRQSLIEFIDAIDSFDYTPSKIYEKNIQRMYDDNFEYAEEKADNESTYPILKTIYKYKADFYAYNDHNFVLKLNPVLNYQTGYSNLSSKRKYINTRGVELHGNISNKIGFYTYAGENQMNGLNYVQDYVTKNYAVPQQGYYKVFKSNASMQDFFEARGYFTFSATKYVHFTFGQDRNFIGEGIRSMILSDASNPTPFLKMSMHYKRFDYQNLCMQLTREWLAPHYDKLLDRKYVSIHHLSYNVTENLQFGAFESVVFARKNQGFEPVYLVPLLFKRSVEQSLGSPDNASLGADARWNIFKRFQLYSQFYLDEFNSSLFRLNKKAWTNKWAIQTGLKWIDFAGIKNLDMQIEGNLIRPFVYSHSDSLGNYTSYNQPLAHPDGASLKELVGKIYYQPSSKITFTAMASMMKQGLDSIGGKYSWGGNPLISYAKRPNIQSPAFPFAIGDGVLTHTLVADINMSCLIRNIFYLDFNFMYRKQSSSYKAYNHEEKYFGIGVRMNTTRSHFLF
ncbi:MAG: hypothetical protein RL708_739 [Bacteroidota bacterium]|jgi:hypothetical protein